MNPKYKVSNTPGNKSKGRYLTSCLAVFASKATQDGSVDRLTLSSSSVLSLSLYLFLGIHLLHLGFTFSFILILWGLL